MSVKVSELPDLIAAAVKKAVADKHITDQQLSALLHHPITLGIVARPEPTATAIKEVGTIKSGPVHVPLAKTLGFELATLDQLRDVKQLKAVAEL